MYASEPSLISALTPAQLQGLDDSHVQQLDQRYALGAEVMLHPLACAAFERLHAAASDDGFDLRVLSGFRSFDRQLLIWNGKASGTRPVLDVNEQPVHMGALDAGQRVSAILRWSALPGCSRHHWGTDLDVIDAAALPPGTPPRLLAADWRGRGMFAALDRWLAERGATGTAAEFFRPYDGVACAVAAEPWHLSYAPLATACLAAFPRVELARTLRGSGLELLDTVLDGLDDILARYVEIPAQFHARSGDADARAPGLS